MTKKPRLFYWEDAADIWAPVPEKIDEIIDIENFLEHGEVAAIRFKRIDMTDYEMENLGEFPRRI